jgi:chromosome segregation ATPase
MTEAVVEKLVEKVINLTGEVNDVNIVVRGISPPQAIVNKIHERIDVLVAAMQQIEKKLDLDEGRLKELEDQTKLLKEEMEFRKSAVHDVEERIIRNNETLGESFYSRLATMDDHARRRFDEMGKTFQSTFWTQKWWLIVLSAVLSIFAIVVIHR